MRIQKGNIRRENGREKDQRMNSRKEKHFVFERSGVKKKKKTAG